MVGGGARGTSYKKAKKYGQSLPTQLRVVLFLFCCCCIFFFLSMKYAILLRRVFVLVLV